MSRLTNKHFSINPPRSIKKCRQDFYIAVEDKLRKLEDIEEEIGFDLIIVATALKRGIYDKRRYYQCACLSLSNGQVGIYVNELDRLFEFKDYGKTWALTKEELEK